MKEYYYDFRIAGISLRWSSGFPLELDERYQCFRQELTGEPDIVCEIRIGQPERKPEQEQLVYAGEWYRITEDGDCRYRTISYGETEQVVTLVKRKANITVCCPDKGEWVLPYGSSKNKTDFWQLYIPEGIEQNFKKTRSWTYYMAFEEMFYEKGRIVLHASYVETNKGAVLFTGASGIGKSTQAELWKLYGGGEIMNGDRTCLYEQDGCLLAAGSPCAGSSKIYRNYQSEIRAIIVLSQGEENRADRLKGKDCILPLMRESSFSYMDEEMRQKYIELLLTVAERVPIYSYRCRKDRSAVETLQAAFDRDGI